VCDSDQVLIAVLKSLPATEFLLQLTACQKPTIKLGSRDCPKKIVTHNVMKIQILGGLHSCMLRAMHVTIPFKLMLFKNHKNHNRWVRHALRSDTMWLHASPNKTNHCQNCLSELELRDMFWDQRSTNWAHNVLHDHVHRNHTHQPGFWMYTSKSQLS
jgi:hypothetical protein